MTEPSSHSLPGTVPVAAEDAKPQPGRPTVVITGASGLIGTKLCHTLAAEYNVVGLDRDSPDDESLPATHIDCDLTDDESVGTALDKLRDQFGPDVASVVHLAAYYDFSGEPSPLYEELTVEGTRHLLREFKERDFNLDQFIFSSSMLVMKPVETGEKMNEDSPTQAEWPYPESKLKTESVICEEQGDFSTVILRIAGVYTDHCDSLPVSQQISRIYEKQMESYVFPGNDEHGQSMIHLDDVADCIQAAIERRKSLDRHELFLIGEPDVMSYGKLQDRIGELLHGKEWPSIRIPKAVAKAGAWVQGKMAGEGKGPFIKPWMVDMADAHYDIDISHAQAELGWTPSRRIQDTLPSMIEYLKQDPERFYEQHKLPTEDLPK